MSRNGGDTSTVYTMTTSSSARGGGGGSSGSRKLDKMKINGTLDILRKEIAISGKVSYTDRIHNENIVIKEEKIDIQGREVEIRRVYMLYGAYRVGWILDDDIQYCMECNTEFNFLNRRHHCRACGNIICSNCSPYKATIPTLDEINGSRVCVNCFGLKVNLNNLRHYANLEEFDSFETISSSDDHGSNYSGGLTPGISPIERDLRHQEHMQHKREHKALSRQKLIEQSRKPQYLRAYRTMRAIVPPDISETNLQAMLRAGLPRSVAERIWKCRCLWLLSMHPEDIKKIHIADLRSKYAPVGLDLTELRAVWHCLPDWSTTDEKEKEKAQWKSNLKIQMDDMVRKDEKGELTDDVRRNEAYLGYEPIRIYSSAPTNISRRYSATELESTDIDNHSSHHTTKLSAAMKGEGSYCTPPRSPPAPKDSKYYSSPLLDDQRRFSFSDADSLSPHTPSPYKTDSHRKHRPHIYVNLAHNSPPVPLFLYRQTSGDLAATEDRERSFLLPPEMHKDDINWIDRFREFFLGSQSTPQKPLNLTSSMSMSASNSNLVPSNLPKLKEQRSLPISRSRAMTENNGHSEDKGMIKKEPSQYRLRREEEKKANTSQRTTSNSPSRSPFATRMRSQSDRTAREKFTPPNIKNSSPNTIGKISPSPVSIPITSPAESPQQQTPDRNPDNCTPLNTRIPFFPPEELASSSSASSSPSISSSSAVMTTPPKSPNPSKVRLSSNSSTILTPQIPKREAPRPPLTATPLREMMGSLPPSSIVQRLKESDLRMSPTEATDLLKYLLVNYGDLNSEYLLPDHKMTKSIEQIEQEEKSMLQTLSILITKCHADVNSADRDGNSLLTFIIQYNSIPSISSPSSTSASTSVSRTQIGINKLVASLVFHGIELFIYNDQSVIIGLHEAFLQLTQEDKVEIIEKFVVCEVNDEENHQPSPSPSSSGSAALNPSQLFNYCVLLIMIGRIKYATRLMETNKIELTSQQASAILKSCQFDNMENPVEAFELLDKCGAQL